MNQTPTKTTYSEKVSNYVENIQAQRDTWNNRTHTSPLSKLADEQKGITNPFEHVMALKEVVDKVGFTDSHESVLHIMTLPETHEYMVDFFKGRGTFTDHFGAVVKVGYSSAKTLGKIEGYEYNEGQGAWWVTKA